MTARKTPLNKRLAELEQSVVAARVHERDVERQHEAAQAEVARISEARLEAFAAQDEKAAKALAAERADAEQRVAEFAERAEGAHRATARADVELGAFAASNLPALLREREPDAQAAVKAVSDALEALDRANGAWHAVESESMRLLRLAGRDTRDQPRFPERLADVVRDARRAGDIVVPLPLPVAAGHGSGLAALPERAVRTAV